MHDSKIIIVIKQLHYACVINFLFRMPTNGQHTHGLFPKPSLTCFVSGLDAFHRRTTPKCGWQSSVCWLGLQCMPCLLGTYPTLFIQRHTSASRTYNGKVCQTSLHMVFLSCVNETKNCIQVLLTYITALLVCMQLYVHAQLKQVDEYMRYRKLPMHLRCVFTSIINSATMDISLMRIPSFWSCLMPLERYTTSWIPWIAYYTAMCEQYCLSASAFTYLLFLYFHRTSTATVRSW